MPRKRQTRAASKTSKCKLKDDGADDGLSKKERELKLAGYLADLEVHVEKFRESYQAQLKMNACLIDKNFTQIRMRYSQAEREMLLEDFILSYEERNQDQPNVEVLMVQQQQPQQPEVRSARSAITDKLSKYRTKRDMEPIAEEGSTAESVRKTSRKAKNSALKGVTFNSENTAPQSSYITPAMNRNASALGWETPLITPKFDPRLPITPAVCRDAKPGEIAMSMAGSPLKLDRSGKTSLSAHRRGRTIQVEIDLPEEYDVDIPDYVDLENSDENIKKMMNMVAMMMRKVK